MKKAIALLLVLVMCLSLCACSSEKASSPIDESETTALTTAPSTEVTEETLSTVPTVPKNAFSNWYVEHYIDEFGDETGDTYISGLFFGNFSNTATSSSELAVFVHYHYDIRSDGLSRSNHSMSFRLLEYNSHKATYLNSDEMVFKVKINGVTEEYKIGGVSPNGDIHVTSDTLSIIRLADELEKGNDIACVIYIGSSKYSFTIKGEGFIDAIYEFDPGIKPDYAEIDYNTAHDIVASFYTFADPEERNNVIANNIELFPAISEEAILEIMDGSFTVANANTLDLWWIYTLQPDNTLLIIGAIGGYGTAYYEVGNQKVLYNREWSASGSLLEIDLEGAEGDSKYTVHKLMDGYYLLCEANSQKLFGLLTQTDAQGTPLFEY